ncbi:MAG: CRISPR-associated helicase Cas3' [Deltaproteobacteria bacterium]|nr:CRISPR-associated helicase Cas3' [Deltaproteobacteria bacterium]
MPDLLSHYDPHLRLREHLEDVRSAAFHLLSSHSSVVRGRRPRTEAVLEAAVRCHDIGKGSPGFQQYIADPPHYRGSARAKEHSGLSSAAAILWARREGWAPLQALTLGAIVAGHHAGFPVAHRLLDERLRLDDEDVLDSQWQGLPWDTLEGETGLQFNRGMAFEDARSWLACQARVEEVLGALPRDEALRFRFWVQFLFSILLEADKAFLALRDAGVAKYLATTAREVGPELVDRRLQLLPDTPANEVRRRVRSQVVRNFAPEDACCTLTLPTGVGKTLLAASWALAMRSAMGKRCGTAPKIVVVLPFLSVVDQTEREYRLLLGLGDDPGVQSDLLMASHSVSQREYELEGERLGTSYSEFFLDTWRSQMVVTTFDQLLLALFSPKTRHQMRFHQLLDAVVVLDEVQALPCRLWSLVDEGFRALTREGNTKVLMMSATQPGMLTGARELVGSPDAVADVFSLLRRYRIRLNHRAAVPLADFIEELGDRLKEWLRDKSRVLLTFNTRAAARRVWKTLAKEKTGRVPVHLLSADVAPLDRLDKIASIKAGRPCIVVSTQTVEAGVDIDMDQVIRDFGPLDAVVQIAGRCNRNNRMGEHGGRVELVRLLSDRGRPYDEMVYRDGILLQATHEVLEGLEAVPEEDVLELGRRYFDLLKARKNAGAEITDAFAYWKEIPDVHELLRGKDRRQVSFLVLEDEEAARLRSDIESALALSDRWERRTALRRLAGDVQLRTVSIYARPDLHPEEFADLVGPFWVLRPGWYTPESGLDLKLDEENPVCIF